MEIRLSDSTLSNGGWTIEVQQSKHIIQRTVRSTNSSYSIALGKQTKTRRLAESWLDAQVNTKFWIQNVDNSEKGIQRGRSYLKRPARGHRLVGHERWEGCSTHSAAAVKTHTHTPARMRVFLNLKTSHSMLCRGGDRACAASPFQVKK